MSGVIATSRRSIIVQGEFSIPAWVDDLASFRLWRLSDDAPTQGEISYLGSDLWVDLSMEEFLTHNQVKAAFDFAIMSVVIPASLGRYVPDRMLLTNEMADLSTEPDGLFATWETFRSQRLRLVERPGQGIMELEGTPDLVIEVISKTSVRKDTVLLRDLYWKAQIAEYWLINVREERLAFEILQWTPAGYVANASNSSAVLGKRFELRRQLDPLGHAQFVVDVSV